MAFGYKASLYGNGDRIARVGFGASASRAREYVEREVRGPGPVRWGLVEAHLDGTYLGVVDAFDGESWAVGPRPPKRPPSKVAKEGSRPTPEDEAPRDDEVTYVAVSYGSGGVVTRYAGADRSRAIREIEYAVFERGVWGVVEEWKGGKLMRTSVLDHRGWG